MAYNYWKERAWIDRKLKHGVSNKKLHNTVGMFSNKNKKKVMSEKGLTEKEYHKRYNFLHNVFNILDNEL